MKTISLNDSWLFRKLPGYTLGNVSALSPEAFPAQTVSLPHTWYTDDEQYKGLCVYEKTLPRPEGKKLFLSFGAADQSCAVYCNGVLCGTHRGGYSRFLRLRFPKRFIFGSMSKTPSMRTSAPPSGTSPSSAASAAAPICLSAARTILTAASTAPTA